MGVGSSVLIGFTCCAVLANYLAHRGNHSKKLHHRNYAFPSAVVRLFLYLPFQQLSEMAVVQLRFFLMVSLYRSLTYAR